MPSVTTAKAKHHGGGKGKGKIRHMRIEPAANGFTSQISRERPAGQMYMDNQEEPPTIHPSISHLTKHVKATFGGGAAEPGEPDEDDKA